MQKRTVFLVALGIAAFSAIAGSAYADYDIPDFEPIGGHADTAGCQDAVKKLNAANDALHVIIEDFKLHCVTPKQQSTPYCTSYPQRLDNAFDAKCIAAAVADGKCQNGNNYWQANGC